MRDAGTVIVESGLGVAFIELIGKSAQRAHHLQRVRRSRCACCAPFLLSELDRVAGCLDWARVPSRALARGFTQDLPLYLFRMGSISEFGIKKTHPIWKRHSRCVGGINAF